MMGPFTTQFWPVQNKLQITKMHILWRSDKRKKIVTCSLEAESFSFQ